MGRVTVEFALTCLGMNIRNILGLQCPVCSRFIGLLLKV
nr:hypothetical protein [Turicimonas muris]